MGCVLLFLLNYAVSGTPTDYRMLPLATDRDVAPAAYYLAKMVLLPKSLVKRKSAGLKSLPLRQFVCHFRPNDPSCGSQPDQFTPDGKAVGYVGRENGVDNVFPSSELAPATRT